MTGHYKGAALPFSVTDQPLGRQTPPPKPVLMSVPTRIGTLSRADASGYRASASPVPRPSIPPKRSSDLCVSAPSSSRRLGHSKMQDCRHMRSLRKAGGRTVSAATCPITPNRALGGKVRLLEQPGRLGLLLARLSLGGHGLGRPVFTPVPTPGRGCGSLVHRVPGCVFPFDSRPFDHR